MPVVRSPASIFSAEFFDVVAAVVELCAPVEAPVGALVEVPFEAPAGALVEVPFDTPVALGVLVTLGLVLAVVPAVVFAVVALLLALVVDATIVSPTPVAVATSEVHSAKPSLNTVL